MVGAAFQEGLSSARRRLQPLLVLSLAVFVPLDLVVAVLDPNRGWGGDAPVVRSLAATLVLALAVTVVYAAAIEILADDRPAFEAALRAARLLPTLVAITVIVVLGVVAGLVLLVVPGLILLAWWAVAYQAAVVERRSWRHSLGRSRELARGRFWPVLGVVVLVSLAVAVGDYVFWRVGIAVLPDTAGAWLGGAIADGILTPLSAAVLTALYQRLRETQPARTSS